MEHSGIDIHPDSKFRLLCTAATLAVSISTNNTRRAAGADRTSIGFMLSRHTSSVTSPGRSGVSQREQIDPKSKRFASQSAGILEMKGRLRQRQRLLRAFFGCRPGPEVRSLATVVYITMTTQSPPAYLRRLGTDSGAQAPECMALR